MPEYFDIHAHLNFAAFDEDREEVVSRTLSGGVWMINVGTQKDTSKIAVEMAENFKMGVYSIVGLHPIHANRSFHDKDELGEGIQSFSSRGEIFDKKYYGSLCRSKKVVAVGECGLDYFRLSAENSKNEIKNQMNVFEAQIDLACECDLPLMIHCRPSLGSFDAYDDVYDILHSYSKNSGERLRANLHFFAGDIDIARKFLDLGFSFSFTAVLTLTTDYDDLVKYLPMENIMSETDCPYVAPRSIRGKRNEPLYVKEVAKRISEIKEIPQGDVKQILVQNALNFFNIKG